VLATDGCFYNDAAFMVCPPPDIDSDISRKAFRKKWAQLIQKIFNVDPLLCPKCLGSMKIISFIEDEEVISKILKSAGGGSNADHLRAPIRRRRTEIG
jgi:hypothetical protein